MLWCKSPTKPKRYMHCTSFASTVKKSNFYSRLFNQNQSASKNYRKHLIKNYAYFCLTNKSTRTTVCFQFEKMFVRLV